MVVSKNIPLAVSLMFFNACAIQVPLSSPPSNRQKEYSRLQKRRDNARTGRTLSTVGLVVGGILTGLGLLVVTSGDGDSSSDGGTVLRFMGAMTLFSGVGTGVGSGLTLYLNSQRLDEVNLEIDKLGKIPSSTSAESSNP